MAVYPPIETADETVEEMDAPAAEASGEAVLLDEADEPDPAEGASGALVPFDALQSYQSFSFIKNTMTCNM